MFVTFETVVAAAAVVAEAVGSTSPWILFSTYNSHTKQMLCSWQRSKPKKEKKEKISYISAGEGDRKTKDKPCHLFFIWPG